MVAGNVGIHVHPKIELTANEEYELLLKKWVSILIIEDGSYGDVVILSKAGGRLITVNSNISASSTMEFSVDTTNQLILRIRSSTTKKNTRIIEL